MSSELGYTVRKAWDGQRSTAVSIDVPLPAKHKPVSDGHVLCMLAIFSSSENPDKFLSLSSLLVLNRTSYL